jgi:hypothetical protein
MDLYTHSATLLSRSLSFVANHPPPPPAHSRFPSKRGAALPSLLAPFFESLPLQTNKQQEESRLQKRPVLFVVLFLFDKLKARRSKLPCLSEALDLMQSTVSLPLKLIELRAVAPADDDRLHPRAPQWCSFSLCLL